MRCSGIIGKVLDKNSEYIPGQKNSSWIKINKSFYIAELDSLNFVIIGANYGRGEDRRTYSSVLLACLNEENGNFEAFALTHGALKERQLGELTFYLKNYIIQYTPNNYKLGKYKPDVIFTPKVIVKAKSFFVCLNPNSAVGYNAISDNYGISIRFPQILKIREDKKINQVCSSEKLLDLYKSQDFINEPDIEISNEEKYSMKNAEKNDYGEGECEYSEAY